MPVSKLALAALVFSTITAGSNARAESAEEQKYSVIEVPSDGIERYMPSASLGVQLPASIQGIWWMDGNPLGDILLTLNGSTYDVKTRTAELKVYAPGSYSFAPDQLTREKYLKMISAHPYMEIQFNETFTDATIVPHHDASAGESIFMPEPEFVSFTMHLVEDGHWVRESTYFGVRAPDYQLRRIVRQDGTRDPAYADYLQFAKPSSLLGYELAN